MNDQLKKSVEAIVDEIFKDKEEAEMKKETEEALLKASETINQLTESLEAKDSEYATEISNLKNTISALETQLNEVAESKKSLEEEKTQLSTERSELIARAEKAEKEIDDMKKDKAAEERLQDLIQAGVSSSDKSAQLAKIREMSDEEFGTYKAELVSIKENILAQLQPVEPAAASVTEPAVVEELAVAEVITEDVVTATQSLDPSQAIAAALNMEIRPNEDVVSKYRQLGSQLAELIKNKK